MKELLNTTEEAQNELNNKYIMKKPPVHRLAYKINDILFSDLHRNFECQAILKVFTFKNLIKLWVYQLRYWYWKRSNNHPGDEK